MAVLYGFFLTTMLTACGLVAGLAYYSGSQARREMVRFYRGE